MTTGIVEGEWFECLIDSTFLHLYHTVRFPPQKKRKKCITLHFNTFWFNFLIRHFNLQQVMREVWHVLQIQEWDEGLHNFDDHIILSVMYISV